MLYNNRWLIHLIQEVLPDSRLGSTPLPWAATAFYLFIEPSLHHSKLCSFDTKQMLSPLTYNPLTTPFCTQNKVELAKPYPNWPLLTAPTALCLYHGSPAPGLLFSNLLSSSLPLKPFPLPSPLPKILFLSCLHVASSSH